MKGRSLLLDSGASVRVHDSTDLHFTNASSYTISFWIRTKSATSAGIYSWGRADGATPGVTLSLRGGKPHVGITATPANIDLTGPNSVADNAWHLLTLTVDAPHTVKLYVDTTVVAQSNVGTLRPHEQNKGPIRIGRLADSTGQFLGMIAKGIIFNKALGPGPVKSMYLDDQSSSPPITGVCAPSSTTLFAVDNNGRALKASGTSVNFGSSQQLPTAALWAVDAFDAQHAMAVGANGTTFVWNDANQTWSLFQINAALITLNGRLADLNAVKFVNANRVLIAGGLERDGYTGRVLLIGVGSWPNYTWSAINLPPVPGCPAPRALSTLTVRDSSAGVAGWDGQAYYISNVVTTPSNITIITPATPASHFTSYDFAPSGGLPNGSVVTDDGHAYLVNGTNMTPYAWASPGDALWTTVWSQTNTYVGGGVGTVQPQLFGILTTMPGSASQVNMPPDHVWFSSCKIPNSTAVRIGGYEGQLTNVYFGQ
jgi:hypothetical protein